MSIKVLMITFNRPRYTELSLQRLCDFAPANLKLTIWDNGSERETIEVLERFQRHPCVEQIIFNESNEKLRRPTNWFWENALDAELIGKVDDDCLVPETWCSVLEQAHRDIARFGIIGCWRFFPEDFRAEAAQKKIASFGKHQIMMNCWVEGSGYLMKREVVNQLGTLGAEETFTNYGIRAAAKGYINGWYYPFLYQEHMDDPRAPHTGIQSEEDFQRLIPLSAQRFGIQTKDQWLNRLKGSAQRLQECSFDPRDYIGWRATAKRRIARLMGKEYFPRVS
jgi:hypothetical protein